MVVMCRIIMQRPIQDLPDGMACTALRAECKCCSHSTSLACSASSDASWYLGNVPLSRAPNMLRIFSLGTTLVQAVVIHLLASLSSKMRNRLAHGLNGNGLTLFGNEVLAALFDCFQTLTATTATTRTTLTELLLAIGNFLLLPSFPRLASVYMVGCTHNGSRMCWFTSCSGYTSTRARKNISVSHLHALKLASADPKASCVCKLRQLNFSGLATRNARPPAAKRHGSRAAVGPLQLGCSSW